ncbi:hypothetical protein GCM10023201_38090 [Actinomycetospora corticicola]
MSGAIDAVYCSEWRYADLDAATGRDLFENRERQPDGRRPVGSGRHGRVRLVHPVDDGEEGGADLGGVGRAAARHRV